MSLLDVRDATKIFGGGLFSSGEKVIALDHVNLKIEETPPRIITIAGESGCGKSTLANAILGFLKLTSGQILYKGKDIASLRGKNLLAYRREVQAVFQDPYAVYNPFYRMRHVFDLAIRHFHLASSRSEARDLMEDALNRVGLRGEEILSKHPHQLSGGQRQRIMMARAYLLKPSLIIADEPVSMVDASLRAMILDIMLRLRDEQKISFLYITHDLSTAYQIGDEIHVIYRGSIAEQGSTVGVIDHPKHPYVQLLLESIPVPDPKEKWTLEIKDKEDEASSPVSRGCRFAPRCAHRMDRCSQEMPGLVSVGEKEHRTACFLYPGT